MRTPPVALEYPYYLRGFHAPATDKPLRLRGQGQAGPAAPSLGLHRRWSAGRLHCPAEPHSPGRTDSASPLSAGHIQEGHLDYRPGRARQPARLNALSRRHAHERSSGRRTGHRQGGRHVEDLDDSQHRVQLQHGGGLPRPPPGPLWFQLYHRSFQFTEMLVRRAEDAGYKAICLTVDIPMRSPRERDNRTSQHQLPWTLPPGKFSGHTGPGRRRF